MWTQRQLNISLVIDMTVAEPSGMLLHHTFVFLVHGTLVWHRISVWRNENIELVAFGRPRLGTKGQLTAAQHRKIHGSTPSDGPRVCCIHDLQPSTESASHDIPNNRCIHSAIGTQLDYVRHRRHRLRNPSTFSMCDFECEREWWNCVIIIIEIHFYKQSRAFIERGMCFDLNRFQFYLFIFRPLFVSRKCLRQ